MKSKTLRILYSVVIACVFCTEIIAWEYNFQNDIKDFNIAPNGDLIGVVAKGVNSATTKLYMFNQKGDKLLEYTSSSSYMPNSVFPTDNENKIYIETTDNSDEYEYIPSGRVIDITGNTVGDPVDFGHYFYISRDGRYILSNCNPSYGPSVEIFDTERNETIISWDWGIYVYLNDVSTLIGAGNYFLTLNTTQDLSDEPEIDKSQIFLECYSLGDNEPVKLWQKNNIHYNGSGSVSSSLDATKIAVLDDISLSLKILDIQSGAEILSIPLQYAALMDILIPQKVKMSENGKYVIFYERRILYEGILFNSRVSYINTINGSVESLYSRLSYNGNIEDCYISSDGKFVFVKYPDGVTEILRDGIGPIFTFNAPASKFSNSENVVYTPYVVSNDMSYIVFANKQMNRILTLPRIYNSFPRWSPDSTKMLFQTEFGGISAMDWTGVLNMGNDLNAKCANWSWDGENIVYVSKINGINGIYTKRIGVANAQPQLQISFVGSTECETYPQFSPDGRKILYGANYSGKWHVYEKERSDSPFPAVLGKQLTSGDNSEEINARYSPDGRRIAYAKKVQYANGWGTWDIYVRDLIEGDEVKITDGGFDELYPCFSPNGREIAFATNSYINPYVNSYSGEWKIWKVILTEQNGRVTGASQPIGLTADLVGMHTMPDWSPNGRSIAYISDQSFFGEIYSRNIEGGLGQTYKITDITVQLNSFLNRQ